MISLAVIVEPVPARRGIDGHTADGVAYAGLTVRMMVHVIMTGAIVTAAAARLRRFLGWSGRRFRCAAAAGTLYSAALICVFGFGHRVLHRATCNPYPVGVYRRDAKRHQDVLPKTAEPDRRPGPRPVQNG